METDYIIVGQGLCGTLLSWCLVQEGKRVIVIDDNLPYAASKVASGLINPITGQRFAKAWMIDELLPAATEIYQAMENELNIKIIHPSNILEFHESSTAKKIFSQRAIQYPQYLDIAVDENNWNSYFNIEYGIGCISPGIIIDMRQMMAGWRYKLSQSDAVMNEKIDWNECKLTNCGVVYKDIKAKKIICCDGSVAIENPYFSGLPFTLNKGEALIAEIPGLPHNKVYKHGLKIAPYAFGLFWIGSSFEWVFNSSEPTDKFRRQTEYELSKWLKLPYKILDHLSSLRPATKQHTPFVGVHPLYPAIGILNGMGAKGCSQAPYFARQLARHLVYNDTLNKEVDIRLVKKWY